MTRFCRVLLGSIGLVFLNFDIVHAAADFGLAGVLPRNRHQTTLRFGTTQDVQQKFSNEGTLQGLSRLNQRMDNNFLKSSSAEFRQFQKIVNEKMFPAQKPANEIDIGKLTFNGTAKFNYFTPQLARGITNNWTVGIAVPIVNFRSTVQASNDPNYVNTASKVFKFIAENTGKLNEQMAQIEALLTAGPRAVFRQSLSSNQYKDLEEKDLTFVGDIVLGSVYRLRETKKWELYLQNYLTLPTGPEDDPDDLVDPSVFGDTNFETTLYNNFYATKWLSVGFGMGYIWAIEDNAEKRVPRFEGDVLPPVNQKENLEIDPGDSVAFKLHIMTKPIRDAELGIGYEKELQQADSYKGARGLRYDLLEKDTESETDELKFKISYTTLDSFVDGYSKVPMSLTYAYSDIVSGENVEKEQSHELLMKFYF